jgi:hypothetical protein
MADLNNVHPELVKRIRWVQSRAAERGAYFWVTTGFRSRGEQERLYAAWQAGIRRYGSGAAAMAHGIARAAAPGRSMHERSPSNAVDLACEARHNSLRSELVAAASLSRPVIGEPWHMQLSAFLAPLPGGSVGPPPPPPPPIIQEIGRLMARRVLVSIGLGADGNGWTDQVDGDANKCIGVSMNGPYPKKEGYRPIPLIAWQNHDGRVVVTCQKGEPGTVVGCHVAFAD